MSRDAIDIPAFASQLERELPGLVAAYVFGSVARGAATTASDLDVGVLLATRPDGQGRLTLLAVADTLTAAVGRSVDLVIMNDAPVDLVHRVLRDGQLVVEHDRSARIRFEVAARNAYFDLAPLLLRYRRAPASVTEP